MSVQLILGDCLDAMRQMEDQTVGCVITDPPYGHNNNNNGDLIQRREAALGGKLQQARPIENDGVEANDLFRSMLSEVKRLLVPVGRRRLHRSHFRGTDRGRYRHLWYAG